MSSVVLRAGPDAGTARDGEALNTARAHGPSRRAVIAVSAALLVGIAGGAFVLWPKSSVSTDAAYIGADSSIVAPRVRGVVQAVLVEHNAPVRRGQPLIAIDSEEFDARAAGAAADLLSAEAGIAAAKAALDALGAEEGLGWAGVEAARTAISAADARRLRADADARRYDALVGSGAVARRDADGFRATAATAQSEAARARADLEVARRNVSVVRARRASLAAALLQARAGAERAKAAAALARQDQEHALVRSPIDGVVGDRPAAVGDFVQPGSRLLSVVPMDALYVTADFKETQVARMLPGQRAVIRVDALPGVRLKGEVESFAPGSGSQFALLPFEPGTGNFTKIVQRVPVRIRFDPGQPEVRSLRPGLSSTVTVELRRPARG